MININLLAPGRRRAAGPTRETYIAAGSIAAVVLVLIIASVILGNRAASLHRQLADVNRQLAALRPIALQVQTLDQTLASLERRQADLKTLLAKQLPASQSLQAIKSVIPSDVWLVTVSTQAGHNVLFDGYTFTYKAVARFMVALRDSERFQNVDLTSTTKDRVADREVVKFQITGELAGTPKSSASPARPDASAGSAPNDSTLPRAATKTGDGQ
jgi:Tfp pilus assembly protein PilN